MPDGIEGFKRENFRSFPKPSSSRRRVKSGKGTSRSGAVKQLAVLKELFSRAERTSWLPDAGREGELIFPLLSITISTARRPSTGCGSAASPSRPSARGWRPYVPAAKYDDLYLSARARCEAVDWIVGINASQALAIAAGRGAWSLGRVQTPYAGAGVRALSGKIPRSRRRPISGSNSTRPKTLRRSPSSRRRNTIRKRRRTGLYRSQGQRRRAGYEGRASKVTEQPPLLYDLTSLQKEANTRHRILGRKDARHRAGALRKEARHLSPHGSRYIPQDVFEEITRCWPRSPAIRVSAIRPPTCRAESWFPPFGGRQEGDRPPCLLITGHTPAELAADHAKIYDMIAESRMVEAFFARVSEREITSVRMECAGIRSRCAVRSTSAGWRRYGASRKSVRRRMRRLCPRNSPRGYAHGTRMRPSGKADAPRPLQPKAACSRQWRPLGRAGRRGRARGHEGFRSRTPAAVRR